MAAFLSSLVKQARKAQRITLRTLGESVGCAASFLSEVENGIRPAPKDENFLIKLANALSLEKDVVVEAARRDRERRNPKRLRDLLSKDDELAACFYRVSDSLTDEQLRAVLLKAFKDYQEKTSNG